MNEGYQVGGRIAFWIFAICVAVIVLGMFLGHFIGNLTGSHWLVAAFGFIIGSALKQFSARFGGLDGEPRQQGASYIALAGSLLFALISVFFIVYFTQVASNKLTYVMIFAGGAYLAKAASELLDWIKIRNAN